MDADKVNGNDAPVEVTPTEAELNEFNSKFKGFDFLANNGGLFGTVPTVVYPPEIERRIKALKKLQVETFETELKFFEELHDLEVKYTKMQAPMCAKRRLVVTGQYEPTDEECDFSLPHEEEEEPKPEVITDTPVSGIPKFWLTIFQNVEQFADMIHDQDVPALEHLEDIQLDMIQAPMGFKLTFFFSPNEFFTNETLTKTYGMKVVVDPTDPFSFEGTEICKAEGCTINWKEGKDLTKKEIKKKQKHKATGAIRVSTKVQDTASFFDFFSPPEIPEGEEHENEELEERLTNDFEVGSFLKERVIPRAVLYFTGEALISDDEEEEEEEEGYTGESGEEENEETEEEDEEGGAK